MATDDDKAAAVASVLDILRPLPLEEQRETIREMIADLDADPDRARLLSEKASLQKRIGHLNDELGRLKGDAKDVVTLFTWFCDAVRGYSTEDEPGAYLMALGRLFVGDEDALASDLADLCNAVEIFMTNIGHELLPSNASTALAYMKRLIDRDPILAVRRLYFARTWARCGFPVIELGHRTAASLMFTHGSGIIEPTWPAFILKLPNALIMIAASEVIRVHVQAPSERVPKWKLWLEFRSDEGGLLLHPFCLESLDGDMDEICAESGRDAGSPNNMTRAVQLVARLVAGICMLMTAKQDVVEREWRPKTPPNRRRQPGVEPQVGTRFIVSRNVELDLREQVHEYISGKSRRGAPLTVQFVVRGHRRWQACGPKHSERKLIWINPFWKGPEDGRALLRGYELGDQQKVDGE